MEQLLHTPEGVRDIYHEECAKKLALQNRLHKTLHLYGYHDIQTPMYEYFDVFRKEIGTIPSRELYKFFDRDGNTLVLRPDITPQIARATATLFKDDEFPARLCYVGNTFINHSSYQGRLKESTQMGAEMIGLDAADADADGPRNCGKKQGHGESGTGGHCPAGGHAGLAAPGQHCPDRELHAALRGAGHPVLPGRSDPGLGGAGSAGNGTAL